MRCALVSAVVLAIAACGDNDGGPPAAPVSWSAAAPVLSGPIQEHGAVAIDGRIYIMGGFDETLAVDSVVSIYDTATDTWSAGPSLPERIHHANVAVVDGTIFVVGALVRNTFETTGAAWSWTPATETQWRVRPSMPAGFECGAAAVGVIDGVIIVAGGLGGGAVSRVVSFDPATDTWTTDLPAMSAVRDHGCAGVIDGTLYVAAGRAAAIRALEPTVQAYRPGQGWTTRAPIPTPRGGVACGVIGGRLIVAGGEGNRAAGSRGVFAEVEAYDPAVDAWTALEPMPAPRHGMGAAVVGDRLYVPGGGDVESFSAVDTHEVLRVTD
jgi:N-acetylneuraminic acid mutarotase